NDAYQDLFGRKLAEAAQIARRALELDPANAHARFILGTVYLEQKQYDDAIREYTEALRLNPELLNAKERLDLALKAKGVGGAPAPSGATLPFLTPRFRSALLIRNEPWSAAFRQVAERDAGEAGAARLADEALREVTAGRLPQAEARAREA